MPRTVRQVVMWSVRGDTKAQKQAARERVRAAYESLRGRIPGMTKLEVGVGSGNGPQACDVVLVADFVSRGALAGFSEHPEHLRVQAELGGLRCAGHQIDFVVADEAR